MWRSSEGEREVRRGRGGEVTIRRRRQSEREMRRGWESTVGLWKEAERREHKALSGHLWIGKYNSAGQKMCR